MSEKTQTTTEKLKKMRDFFLDKGKADDVVHMATIVSLLNILIGDENE